MGTFTLIRPAGDNIYRKTNQEMKLTIKYISLSLPRMKDEVIKRVKSIEQAKRILAKRNPHSIRYASLGDKIIQGRATS